MRIYWSVNSMPELQSLPKAERGRVWRKAYGQSFRYWQTWVGVVLLGICAFIGGAIGGHLGYVIWGSVIGGGLGGFLFLQTLAPVIQRIIIKQIRSGYDLNP